MAGSISISQPGGVGTVSGGVVQNGARIYPTFIGATTTTWTWGLVTTKASSGAVMARSNLQDPYFSPDDDSPITVTFIDSNGILYMTGLIACNPADVAVELPPND